MGCYRSVVENRMNANNTAYLLNLKSVLNAWQLSWLQRLFLWKSYDAVMLKVLFGTLWSMTLTIIIVISIFINIIIIVIVIIISSWCQPIGGKGYEWMTSIVLGLLSNPLFFLMSVQLNVCSHLYCLSFIVLACPCFLPLSYRGRIVSFGQDNLSIIDNLWTFRFMYVWTAILSIWPSPLTSWVNGSIIYNVQRIPCLSRHHHFCHLANENCLLPVTSLCRVGFV